MNPKALKFRIGLFLFLALALFLGSLFFFGIAGFFQQKTRFVSFFNESVMGLNKGSLVRFRGVEVGEVTEVKLSLDNGATHLGIPVIYEIDISRLQNKLGVPVDISKKEPYENAIRDGLSAKLSNSSFVTGQLYVDLNFRPKTVGKTEPGIINGDLHLVPAVPSLLADVSDEMVSIIRQISQINFVDLSKNLDHLLTSSNQLVEDFAKQGVPKNLNATLTSIHNFIDSDDLHQLTGQMAGAAGSLTELFSNLNTGKGALGKPMAETLEQMADTAQSFDQISRNFAQLIEGNSGPVADFERTLNEIEEATIAFQSLLEFLRRHPNALIFGKETP